MNYGGGENSMGDFPMLGFCEERIIRRESDGFTYYACRLAPNIAAAVWRNYLNETRVNFYRLRSPHDRHPLTDAAMLSSIVVDDNQFNRVVDDPLHAQTIIFAFIQTHLPREVTDNAA